MVSTAAFHARVWGSVPGLGGLKETKLFLPHPRVKVSIVGGLRDREVACSASDRQGPNFESCVWRTVSSQSSHHPQEVLLAQFSLYVHKGGLKPDSFYFISFMSKYHSKYFYFVCCKCHEIDINSLGSLQIIPLSKCLFYGYQSNYVYIATIRYVKFPLERGGGHHSGNEHPRNSIKS